jgi:hypothetical protein
MGQFNTRPMIAALHELVSSVEAMRLTLPVEGVSRSQIKSVCTAVGSANIKLVNALGALDQQQERLNAWARKENRS